MPTLAEVSTEITMEVSTLVGWALSIIGALVGVIVFQKRENAQLVRIIAKLSRNADDDDAEDS